MREDPDFKTLQTIQRLYAEDGLRKRKSIQLDVRCPSFSDGAQFVDLVAPGTLVVVLTTTGSEFLSDLKQSLSHNLARAESLLFGMKARLSRRKPVSFSEAVDMLVSLNSLVDIRHGGRTIATNVPVVSDHEATIFTFPYLGGSLSSGGIRLMEKYRDGPGIDGLALLRAPGFSPTEIVANEIVGDDERELQIGAPSMCYAASAATVAVTVATVTVAISATLPDEDQVSMSDLDPHADVASLIAQRRQVLKS